MKIIITTLLVLVFLSPALSQSLTEEERSMTVAELENTRDMLEESTSGLSSAQLNFKSSEDSWSIAECVEHLAISENSFGEMIKGALNASPDPSKRAEVKITDGDLLAMIRDRSGKVKTSEPFEPSGKFGTYQETLEVFMGLRDTHIALVDETEEDLRYRYGQLPFGTIDGLQIILFMSGHTERHIKQIMEIKESEGYPLN
ncbi:MAG: DinB family protein [Flavobacteriaceae bacterium]|nr:DinB family protein [Flavobacteriaceae bacterium]MDH3795781.1 DinB family protein [Flavobacteriaceae bacterium]